MADINSKQKLFFFQTVLLYFNCRIKIPANDSSKWNREKKRQKNKRGQKKYFSNEGKENKKKGAKNQGRENSQSKIVNDINNNNIETIMKQNEQNLVLKNN